VARYKILDERSVSRYVADIKTRLPVIRSFANKETEDLFKGDAPRGVAADLARAARRRLQQLDAALRVEDMRTPPGNRLHKVGEVWSISVNMQYRITFAWSSEGPEDVWFGDYH
jgi:toxin HigB-1